MRRARGQRLGRAVRDVDTPEPPRDLEEVGS
jgi:hypothetical protein